MSLTNITQRLYTQQDIKHTPEHKRLIFHNLYILVTYSYFMRIKYIPKDKEKYLIRAKKTLLRSLEKGDIILTAPIPKTFVAGFSDLVVLITRKTFRGITHSCIYLGNGKILDIDFNPLERESNVKKLKLEKFLSNKIKYFGGVSIYVVKPRYYSKYKRELVVQESLKTLSNNQNHRHSAIESLKLFFRHVFNRRGKYKENLNYTTNWTCSYLVAHMMKKSGTKIGRRASYMFTPATFAFSKYFHVKDKVVIK